MRTATYLYCVVRSPRKPSTKGVPGGLPEASAVEALKLTRSLWMIASEVPLDVYGRGALEPRLTDLEWVGAVALAHDAVVAHFAGRTDLTVVPMKLFTLFSNAGRAAAEIKGRASVIEMAARRIAGAEEWGLRITRAAGQPTRPLRGNAAPGGKAYLTARKQARDAVQAARVHAAEASLDTFNRLSRLARESRRRDQAPAPGVKTPLLDAVFLVPVADRRKFAAAARRHASTCEAAGAHVTLTGPWPAYNFVSEREGTP